MGMTFNVKEADARDFQTVVRFTSSLHEHELGEPPLPIETMAIVEQCAKALQIGGPTVLIAWDGEVPAGMVWCFGKGLYGRDDGRTMRVDILWIEPQYRKTRCLKVLWDAWHEMADEFGIERIQCSVSVGNKESLNHWLNRGAKVRAYILERPNDGQIKRSRRFGRDQAISERSEESSESNHEPDASRPTVQSEA